jgi:hypothetical protein
MATRSFGSLNKLGESPLRNVLKLSAIFFLSLWPFLYLTTTINDDAFVYYTYAKNFALGNFFAYDPRGIPSEGFTSVLYMILLVPFERLQIPLPLAALLINIVSILIAAFLSCRIFVALFPKKAQVSYLAGIIFLLCTYLDSNLTGLMGWGLETILNVPIFLSLIYNSILLFKSGKRSAFDRVLFLFGLSLLVRPENLVLGAPWVLVGYLSLSSKKEGIRSGVIFLSVLAGLLAVKYLIFGDLVPTGYYRKMSGQPLNPNYLKSYLKEYAFVFHPVYWLGMACLILSPKDIRENSVLKRACVGFLLMLGALMLFILKVEPIQGYSQRYLTMGTISLYLIVSMLFALVIPSKRVVEYAVLAISVFALFSGGQQRYRKNPLALYRESIDQMNRDPYVALSRYLQKNIGKPKDISLMFGDAGSIPYFFDCKFIDINGLTEPYIAKMFSVKKREEKVADYISSKKLDMAVLAVENQWINLSKDSQRLPQGPLKTPKEYAHLLRKMKKDGFAYAGTIHAAVYDLHFGLNKNSASFAELQKVLSDYIALGKGSIKDSDLHVEFTDGDVVFENIHRSVDASEKEQEISRTL